MELHIGLRLVLLVNMAKTIANCENVVIHVKKEYKTLNTKLSWDKLIMAKCQKQACLFSFVVITALLNVAHRERKALFSQLRHSKTEFQEHSEPSRCGHVVFWYLYYLLEIIPFTKNIMNWRVGILTAVIMQNVLTVVLFPNSLHMHIDTWTCVFDGNSRQLRPWHVDPLSVFPGGFFFKGTISIC